MDKQIKIIRIIWISLLGLIILGLLWLNLVPLGKMTYLTSFENSSYAISSLLPADRVIKVNGFKKIIAEPVYFTLFTPRAFKKALITINFSAPPELARFGVAHNKKLWQYDLKTIYSKLDNKSIAKKLANGDWQVVIDFALAKAERDKGRYSFMISAPALKESDNFIIKSVEVEFSGTDLFSFIKERFNL
jgi:hypothetical protein